MTTNVPGWLTRQSAWQSQIGGAAGYTCESYYAVWVGVRVCVRVFLCTACLSLLHIAYALPHERTVMRTNIDDCTDIAIVAD